MNTNLDKIYTFSNQSMLVKFSLSLSIASNKTFTITVLYMSNHFHNDNSMKKYLHWLRQSNLSSTDSQQPAVVQQQVTSLAELS